MSDTAKSEKLRQAIAAKDAERGRPLTDRERLENIAELLAGDADAADTAKSAREIIADQLESDDGKGGWAFDMEADRIIAALRAKDLEIRPIAPVATPAVGEVNETEQLYEAAKAYVFERQRIKIGSIEYSRALSTITNTIAAIAPRLKAEGMREAAAIVRPLKLGQFIKHPVGAMAGAADLIEARADAMEKGEA